MSRNICGLHFNGSLCDFLVPQVGPFHLRGEIKVWNKGTHGSLKLRAVLNIVVSSRYDRDIYHHE
jgi:hypothetical protein